MENLYVFFSVFKQPATLIHSLSSDFIFCVIRYTLCRVNILSDIIKSSNAILRVSIALVSNTMALLGQCPSRNLKVLWVFYLFSSGDILINSQKQLAYWAVDVMEFYACLVSRSPMCNPERRLIDWVWLKYRLRSLAKQGDNALGSVRPSVCPSALSRL